MSLGICGSGFHSLAPDQVFHEVVDEGNGRRLPEGETGMLAFTQTRLVVMPY